jgi:hypothetical protein
MDADGFGNHPFTFVPGAFANVEELRKRPPINQHQNEVSLAAVKAALAYFGDD